MKVLFILIIILVFLYMLTAPIRSIYHAVNEENTRRQSSSRRQQRTRTQQTQPPPKAQTRKHQIMSESGGEYIDYEEVK